MAKAYIIHENHVWTQPLRAELEKLGVPYEDWFLDEGVIDLEAEPPEGVFYNRMSASSHTRDHRFGHEYTGAVIAWLERHGRRVLNSGRANLLEVNKVAQSQALRALGVRTPRTIAVVGQRHLVEAAKAFGDEPFITKHNRGGKGLGVRLFRSQASFEAYVTGPEFEQPLDGITLLQAYIQAPEPFITRFEFIGQRFLYAVRVDTSEGFELCPADACQVGDLACPANTGPKRPKFEILEGFDSPLIPRFERFLRDNGAHIAAFEVIVDREGRDYTYDVNMNTNYNSEAEARAGQSAMGAIARYLGDELARLYRPALHAVGDAQR